MKRHNKMLSLFLAVIMLLTFTVPAYASVPDSTFDLGQAWEMSGSGMAEEENMPETEPAQTNEPLVFADEPTSDPCENRSRRQGPREPLPLSQQKEFKAIKNIVIAEAMRLGSFDSPVMSNDESVFTAASDSEPDFFDEPEDDPEYRVEWSDEYKIAREFLFGTKTIAPDFDEAHALLLMEAQSGNALTMHDLGRMYADGLGRDADAEAAQDWYAKALDGFLAVATTTRKPYIQYRIGKMYAAGLGTEQDYEKAAEWFSSAAQKNHK